MKLLDENYKRQRPVSLWEWHRWFAWYPGTRQAAWLATARDTIEMLAERWPQCFVVYQN